MNGTFADKDLIDELSLIVSPVIDCGEETTLFETGPFIDHTIVSVEFELLETRQIHDSGIWLHYVRKREE